MIFSENRYTLFPDHALTNSWKYFEQHGFRCLPMVAAAPSNTPVVRRTKRSKQGGNAVFPPRLPSSASSGFEQSRADHVNTALGVFSGRAQPRVPFFGESVVERF